MDATDVTGAEGRADHHILVVDDDDRIRRLVQRYLQRHGLRVSLAADAASARRMLESLVFDALVLDVMMPGEDGLSLLSGLKAQQASVPMILLTALGAPADRVAGLKRGADDYLVKPFEPEELLLRVHALLRRVKSDMPQVSVRFAGYEFDTTRGALTRADGKPVRLTSGEVQLLKALASNPGEAVSREALATLSSVGAERSVDVAMTRLRRKIEPDPQEPVVLQTVRGIGYRLMVD